MKLEVERTNSPISQISSNQGAKESSSRKNTGNQTLLPSGQGESLFDSFAGIVGGDWDAGEQVDEVGHAHDTRNVAGVETEEDTAKGCEGAHQVGFDGDGRLNARHVGGCEESACHDDDDDGEEWTLGNVCM